MKTYEEIGKRIAAIDFDRLWPGFHPYPFALYDERKVYLSDRVIPIDDRFKGNTAITFEGRPLAIWNMALSPVSDMDVLSSKIIHEMFHAYQMEQGETRFPNELEALRLSYDAVHLTHRFSEDVQLMAYVETKDQKALDRFIGLRKTRRARNPQHLAYEERIEVIEGMAHYVEMLSLKQLDHRLYDREMEETLFRLQDQESLIRMRVRCYDSGTLMLLSFADRVLKSHKPIGKEGRTLFELIDQGQKAINHDAADTHIAKIVFDTMEKRKKTVDDMKNKASHVKEGLFRIKGLDPMNSWIFKDTLYCKHFLMVEDDEGETHVIAKPSLSSIDDRLVINRIDY